MDSPNKKEFAEEFLYIKFNQDFLKAFFGWRFQDYSYACGVFKSGSSAFNFCVETNFSTKTTSTYSSFNK